MAKLTIKGRVANGARWLDENFPGWEERIDPKTLMIWSGYDCICGQLFADEAKKSRAKGVENGYDWARSHLFYQANSWISEMVGEATVRKFAWNNEGGQRSIAVAKVLGFSGGDDATSDQLEKSWKKLLKYRAKVNSVAT
jgi:hypothetical protein